MAAAEDAAPPASLSSQDWDTDDLLRVVPRDAHQAVLDLRRSLEPFLDADPVASEHADAITLYRFVVARQGDLDAAAEMFRSSHEWRRSKEVDLAALKAR